MKGYLSRHEKTPFAKRLKSFLMAVGTLLTVFGFLTGRATAMSAGDISFLLSFGLHFSVLPSVIVSRLAEHYSATGYYIINVTHRVFKGKRVKK